MKQPSDSKQRIVLVQSFAEGTVAPDVIQIVPIGEWDHPLYGPMKITPPDITEFKQNFDAKVRLDIPITQGHDNGMSSGELPAIAWFTELIDRAEGGLWGQVKWTDEGKTLLESGAFKYFSPEFYDTYSDPQTGEKRKHVLVGGALTNKPYFKELEAVCATFSEPDIMQRFNTQTMDLNTILAKKADELSEVEKAFLVEHKSELNEEQKTTFESVLPAEGGEDEGGEGSGDGANEGDGNVEGDGKKEASENKGAKGGKMVQMSEVELQALRNQADQGAQAFSELQTMKLEKEVEKLVFSESNKEGRILPKQKGAVVDLMKTLSEKQRDQFRNILNNVPKAVISMSELGDGGTNETDPVKQLDIAVKAKMKENDKLTYTEALGIVKLEKPELMLAYNETFDAQ